MGNYKRQVQLDDKIVFVAKDGVSKVEVVVKNGIPQNVFYGREYYEMNRDFGACQNMLELLITISIDCFIELVKDLSQRTACYKYAINLLRSISQEKNNQLDISQEQTVRINKILEKAPL